MKRVVIAFALSIVACSPLPEVGREVCGNKVVEAGELCDTFTPYEGNTRCGAPSHEHKCAFVCDLGAECPAGWGCGADGRCRLPAARFTAEPDTYDLPGTSVATGDVDGDGDIDLVGVERDRLALVFGGAEATFTVPTIVDSRLPTGRSQFVDFDGDRQLDVLVPSVTGLLVWLGQAERQLVPRAYDVPLEDEDVTTTLRLVVLRERSQIVQERDVLAFTGSFAASLVSDDLGPALTLPSGLTVETLPESLPMADVDFPPDGRKEIALAAPGGQQIDVLRIEAIGETWGPQVQTTIDSPRPLRGPVFFADMNADGRPDVVAPVNQGLLIAYAFGDGFAPACVQGVPGIEQVRMLGAADLDGDGLGDLIFDRTLAMNTAGRAPDCIGLSPFWPSQPSVAGAWEEAELGDFNGDGRTDVALSVPEDDRIDIYHSSGGPLLNRRSVLLSSPAEHLVVGDFDGDFVDDLAYLSERNQALGDEMSVVFGDFDGSLSEPTVVGRFGRVTDVSPANWPTSLENFDALTDLFVVSETVGSPGTWAIALLHGSPARRLFAPLLSSSELAEGEVSGVVAGNFCGDDLADVAMVNASAEGAEIWFGAQVPSEPPGAIDATARLTYDVTPGDRLRFDFSCATWTAGDWDGDGRDEIFAFDQLDTGCGRRLGRSTSSILYYDISDDACVAGDDVAITELAEAAGNAKAELFDVDRDGDPDLFAVFRGRNGNGDALWVLVNRGGAPDPAAAQRLSVPTGVVADVAFAQLDEDPAYELVVLAREAGRSVAYRFDLDGAAFGGGSSLGLDLAGARSSVVAGDFDEDGLDDVGFAGGDVLDIYLGRDGATP